MVESLLRSNRFSNNKKFNICLFFMLLLMYFLTLGENFLIIILVSYNKSLHSPMYLFLTQLSVSDIMLTIDIVPNMLNIVLNERPSISFSGCITQLYFFGLPVGFECFLLTVMSYDRYLAICSPLHYSSIMNQAFSVKLILASWLLSCSISLIFAISICQLHFCGPNTIDHFFCDLEPLLKLSCSDVTMVQIEASIISIPDIVIPFILTVVSYMYIVVTIVKIPSFSGRLKSFSTCSSHLAVVSMYYGTLTIMYVLRNEDQSQIISRILAAMYTVLTPFLNPFIYCLKNKDIKEAYKNIVYKQRAYFSTLGLRFR
ncbi:olfactory receptor 1468-like [Rana temporaria]|uniref:olfactory receptor 1468-like n=1 Tax=Rana temporaria TaxID=8407 RepID=UPI001AAD5EE5|nr:olfactory receptor 1468-like [Rana temporaria]